MPANYDKIAKYYDRLSRLVFRHSLIDAQTWMLKYIRPGSHILIAGGGTGVILEELAKIYPDGLSITFVESSLNMIAIARQKNRQHNQVCFIHQSIEDYDAVQTYDVLLTPFLFDNFTKNKIQLIFRHLDAMLKPGGLWLFTDFFYDPGKGKLWQKLLLKIMYRFFRLTCRIEATGLTDMTNIFECSLYQKINESTRYAGFIKSTVYEKRSYEL